MVEFKMSGQADSETECVSGCFVRGFGRRSRMKTSKVVIASAVVFAAGENWN